MAPTAAPLLTRRIQGAPFIPDGQCNQKTITNTINKSYMISILSINTNKANQEKLIITQYLYFQFISIILFRGYIIYLYNIVSFALIFVPSELDNLCHT